jgi:hypothetical protein
MSEYIFPFHTCEKPHNNGIAQPYSAAFNAVNCIIILYFITKTKNIYTFLLLLSILCFELFHTYSHITHLDGIIQTYIIHSITYLMNLAFFMVFYTHTGILPNQLFLLYVFVLICIDIYSVLNLSLVYYFMTQSILFISLLVYYLPNMPKYIQISIYQIIFFVCLIILLFFNEIYNCHMMLEYNQYFPYHIFIEFIGIIIFYIISSNFSRINGYSVK